MSTSSPVPSYSATSAGPDGAGRRRRTDDGAGATPEPDVDVVEVVRAAARAVLDRPGDWRWEALNPDEAQETMDALVAVITADEPVDKATRKYCTGVISLSLRLSELLRRELLSDPRGLPPEAQLDVVRRIDTCREALEPRARQDLAYHLTGANAMELVVEFAHDLRSPLTSIMFLAETLRRGQSGEINDVQREQLGIVYSAALGMVGVANDLMDLANSETDEDWGQSPQEQFSIKELVESVRDMVAPMAEQKHLDVSYYVPDHDSRIGHPILISRVLLNLVTNAIKFTDSGRVEIVVDEQPGDRVEFSVSDTGRGMTQETLQSLYTLFGRSQTGTGYHFSGTGLGLSICQRMVTLMGGSLDVESQVGEGTRFFFELQLERA